jgi:hypothetical protein
MNAPISTSGISSGETMKIPATPIATAPTSPAAASTTRAVRLSFVFRGRPRSSSSACALIPTARKNATSAAARRSAWIVVAAAAPRAT